MKIDVCRIPIGALGILAEGVKNLPEEQDEVFISRLGEDVFLNRTR